MGTPRAKREPANRGLVLSVERERLQHLQYCASPACFQATKSSFLPSYMPAMPTFPLPGPFTNFTLLPHPYPARPSLPNINLTLFQTTARSRFQLEALPWGSMAGEVPLGRLWVRAGPRCEIGSCRCEVPSRRMLCVLEELLLYPFNPPAVPRHCAAGGNSTGLSPPRAGGRGQAGPCPATEQTGQQRGHRHCPLQEGAKPGRRGCGGHRGRHWGENESRWSLLAIQASPVNPFP